MPSSTWGTRDKEHEEHEEQAYGETGAEIAYGGTEDEDFGLTKPARRTGRLWCYAIRSAVRY
eukprot:738919-Rhodomonas_salina.1